MMENVNISFVIIKTTQQVKSYLPDNNWHHRLDSNYNADIVLSQSLK